MTAEHAPLSPLEQRVRRLAVLAPVFAVLSAVFGMFPRGMDVGASCRNPSESYDFAWMPVVRAGGLPVVGWGIAQLVLGRATALYDSRRSGPRGPREWSTPVRSHQLTLDAI